MKFWKGFERSFRWDQPNVYAFSCFKLLTVKVEWFHHQKTKNNIYCTLGDHCTTIFQPNELKSMRFWKGFERSFRWDQPNFYALKCSKSINSQSWMVPSPKKSIFTVLSEITVPPFLNQMSWNSWDSERVLKALSDETNQICML